MRSTAHRTGDGRQSRKAFVALAVLVKLSLVAAFLFMLKLGTGYLDAGAWTGVLHGLLLVVVAAAVFWGSLRHRRPHSGAYGASERNIGIVLHRAAGYDLLACVLTFGREGPFRDRTLRLADLQPGEAMLDVACGTGTLAMAAKRLVGPAGSVAGVDASAEMIDRARSKAVRAGLEIDFVNATAQEIPFPNEHFDVVIGTLMLHHLSRPARSAFFREARRVLKSGGRLVLIDFGRPPRQSRLPRLHRHGHVDMDTVGARLAEDGFRIADSGAVGTMNLSYVRATASESRPA